MPAAVIIIILMLGALLFLRKKEEAVEVPPGANGSPGIKITWEGP